MNMTAAAPILAGFMLVGLTDTPLAQSMSGRGECAAGERRISGVCRPSGRSVRNPAPLFFGSSPESRECMAGEQRVNGACQPTTRGAQNKGDK